MLYATIQSGLLKVPKLTRNNYLKEMRDNRKRRVHLFWPKTFNGLVKAKLNSMGPMV